MSLRRRADWPQYDALRVQDLHQAVPAKVGAFLGKPLPFGQQRFPQGLGTGGIARKVTQHDPYRGGVVLAVLGDAESPDRQHARQAPEIGVREVPRPAFLPAPFKLGFQGTEGFGLIVVRCRFGNWDVWEKIAEPAHHRSQVPVHGLRRGVIRQDQHQVTAGFQGTQDAGRPLRNARLVNLDQLPDGLPQPPSRPLDRPASPSWPGW